MKFFVKKVFGKLIPVYNSDCEALKECKLKEGEVYEVEIKKKRNTDFHRKYFALINLCFENLPDHYASMFEDIDMLRYYLTVKAGYYKRTETDKGVMIIPLSIKFSKMDDTEFTQLYQKTINQVCKLLNIEEGDLLEEIINFM